jgi:hypothetical protein
LYIGTGAVYIGGATSTTRATLESSTNALLINANNGGGRVGIGTTNPAVALDVSGDIYAESGAVRMGGTPTSGLLEVYDTTASGTISGMRFVKTNVGGATVSGTQLGLIDAQGRGTSGIGTAARILMVQDGASSGNNIPGYISFLTATSTSSTLAERVRITSDGNVGIGTANPVTLTHLHKESPYASRATNPLVAVSGAPQLTLGAGTARLYFGIYQTGGTTAATIQSSVFSSTVTGRDILLNPIGGFVGIGTNAPGVTLDVAGDAQSQNMYIKATATGTQNEVRFTYGSTNVFGIYRPLNTNDLRFYNYAGGNFDQLTLKTNGNVGIGTDPGYKLDVNGNVRTQGVVYAQRDSITDPQIIASGAGANNNKYTYMGYNTTSNWGFIGAVESGVVDRDLHIQAFGANVRIGSTTAPAYKLDVTGDVNIVAGSSYRIGGIPVLASNNNIFASANFRYDGPTPPYYTITKSNNINSTFAVLGTGDIQIAFTNWYNPGGNSGDVILYVCVCTAAGQLLCYPIQRFNNSVRFFIKDVALTFTNSDFSFIIMYNG